MEERLQKIISCAGVASRRAAEQMILAGRVTVDGQRIAELGTKWDPLSHEICVDGKPIMTQEPMVYLLLNKPKGYISSAKDDRGRRTVLDLLPDVMERVYPVGRLDYDTEGLILITNDGLLTHGLLHPKYEVEKTYVARLRQTPAPEDLAQLKSGIMLDDGMTAPARVRLLPNAEDIRIEITIHEGRNRQVRRMLAAVGCEVLGLRRTRFAGLSLGGVRRGQHRRLMQEEITSLRRIAGLEAT